jgi:hypothetical protein
MSIIDKLASAQNRRDEVPNQDLAKEIAAESNTAAVEEMVSNLSAQDKNIQSDCIKTLYEIGKLKPELIAPHAEEFLRLLDSKNNRLQWGAMTALGSVAALQPGLLYKALPRLAAIAEAGSVITRDHYVAILTTLLGKEFEVFDLLKEQLSSAPANQLPMYAERTAPLINAKQQPAFIQVLRSRLADFDKESKRKRIEKVLRKLESK